MGYLKELAARRELLRDHARDGNHRQPAVVELLGLHLELLLRVRRVQVHRVPLEVAGHAVLLQRPEAALAERVLERENREDLDDADVEHDDGPELLERRLLVRDVRRHIDGAAEQRVEVLRDGEPDRREHRDAAVLELALAEVFHARLRRAGAEADGVEVAHRARDARGHVEGDVPAARRRDGRDDDRLRRVDGDDLRLRVRDRTQSAARGRNRRRDEAGGDRG
mmetsp:Transcript_16360/g.50596  ORF Transcript_16360/g.50596 Transcript_16360/m.50596 type:complete len:224 (-) Transcript_16360:86-757(-)